MVYTFDYHSLALREQREVERLIVETIRRVPELSIPQIVDKYVMADIMKRYGAFHRPPKARRG